MIEVIIDGRKYIPVEEKVEEKKYANLSKLVWKLGNGLAIMWDTMLKSYSSWDKSILYNNHCRNDYKPCTNFEETTLEKLEVWDVFVSVLNWDTEDYTDVSIPVWCDDEWYYRYQYLYKSAWIEYIKNGFDDWRLEVIRFLRN